MDVSRLALRLWLPPSTLITHRSGTTSTITLPPMNSLGALHSIEIRMEGNCGRVEFASVVVKADGAEECVQMRGASGGNMVLVGGSGGLLARNEGVSAQTFTAFSLHF